MTEDYEVQAGDCMSSIAYAHGFFWQTLWDLPANASLKNQRKNPNVLMAGDVVHIPDLTLKQEPGAPEQRHTFLLKGVPEQLRMKLLDAANKPRPNLDYIIVIDGKSRRGQTDANGELNEDIPPDARSGKLIFDASSDSTGKSAPVNSTKKELKLQLGNLDPVSEPTGLKARLANLGFYKGPVDDQVDDATKQAIGAFQNKQGLPVTGIADDATQARLQELHGH